MSGITNAMDLPLLSRRPDSWAGVSIEDVRTLLNKHAYLEKAASTHSEAEMGTQLAASQFPVLAAATAR